MASIAFDGVSKVFPDGTRAVNGLDLDVADGGFTVLVGPSGSGKSTALRMVAGLEETSEGEIRIAERVVNDVAPKDRDIAMVFQSYALYPHMSVEENLGFALKMQGASCRLAVDAGGRRRAPARHFRSACAEAAGAVRRSAAACGPWSRDRAPACGVPDGRAVVEPRRQAARGDACLHRAAPPGAGTTTLYVTHDQTEAMTMGDRVAVMRDGRVEQVDAPQVLPTRPANLFVAAFIGSPAMNLLRGRIDGRHVVLGGQRLVLPDGVPADRPEDVIVGIQPRRCTSAATCRWRSCWWRRWALISWCTCGLTLCE